VVQFLRRLALLAVVLAAVLLAGPRVLREFGLVGGGTRAALTQAERAVEVARAYGAQPDDPAFRTAQAELKDARELAQRGERRRARQAAEAARDRAIEAQRYALAHRNDLRRRAERIVGEIDQRLNQLEELYGRRAKELDQPAIDDMLGVMRTARQTGAAVMLDQEQGSYDRVVAAEAETLKALDEAREHILAERKR